MNNDNEERVESRYATIPFEVFSHKELSNFAKVLYCELSSLDTKYGYAWVSNNYLAKVLNTSKSPIQRGIKELSNYGFIKVDFDNTQKNDTKRKIYLIIESGKKYEESAKKNRQGVVSKMTRGGVKNDTTGGVKNDTQECIYLECRNEKVDIYIPIQKLPTKELQDLMTDFINQRNKLKQKVTYRAVELLCEKVMKIPEHKREQAIKNSIMNGWKGIFEPKDEKLDEEYKRVSIESKKAYIKEQEEKHKTNTQKIAEMSQRTDMLEQVIPSDMAKALEIVGGKNDKRRSECISGDNQKLLSNQENI